ncbi:hypothetical protein H5410_013081 [Solanum commersonii]|uniref:Uncharacterized protein n=1 Tax=Solanum commersonii TaxID=4109 RepID=A0A9J6AUP0_SOLCO|nr:hypothetical protein H5410_013081 [Solanum commersonii]
MARCSIMRLEHCRIELGPLHAVFIALSFGLCFLKGCWCPLFAHSLTRWCLTSELNVLFPTVHIASTVQSVAVDQVIDPGIRVTVSMGAEKNLDADISKRGNHELLQLVVAPLLRFCLCCYK